MREWLSGRASPCQGERREFESRLPLHKKTDCPWRLVFCLIDCYIAFFILLRGGTAMEPVVVKYSRVKLLLWSLLLLFLAGFSIRMMYDNFFMGFLGLLFFVTCLVTFLYQAFRAKTILLIGPVGFTFTWRGSKSVFVPWQDVYDIFLYRTSPRPFFSPKLLGIAISDLARMSNPNYPPPSNNRLFTDARRVTYFVNLFLANKSKKEILSLMQQYHAASKAKQHT